MKIQLLVATSEQDYADHLAQVLTKDYADVFEVTFCTSLQLLEETLHARLFDIGLFALETLDKIIPDRTRLPILLLDESETPDALPCQMGKVKKYQRISTLVSDIMEQYAKADKSRRNFFSERAHITLVWSPIGGCGKTTVALAYAAHQCLRGKKTTYLDMEPFSSTEVFFDERGKSISTVFEKLDGNTELLLKSIEKQDHSSGIFYFSRPNNYDDMNILSADDVLNLAEKCAGCTDILVIDVAGTYDDKVRRLMELADEVLLVSDGSKVSQVKLEQFQTQHNVFDSIKQKLVLVKNRGATVGDLQLQKSVSLPLVQSNDPVIVYKTLSSGYFDALLN